MPSVSSSGDAKQPPSPFGDGLVRRRAGRQEWHVRPDLAEEFLGSDGLRLAEWRSAGLAAVVKTGPHRTVYKLALPSGVYYLKHYKLAGPRAWFQNNLRPCRAYREAVAGARLASTGVPSAEAVAAGRITDGPFSRDSFFVSCEIPGVAPLDECFGANGESASWPSAARRELTSQLAALTAALHRAGLFHADYHAGNVLVRREGSEFRLWLIDLLLLVPSRMTPGQRQAMLGMLAASLTPHTTRSDRRRFFESYAAAIEAAGGPREVEAACAAEVRFRLDRADRKWRRGNRRLMILDADGIACRGLAELGRETLISLRDDVLPRDLEARREPRPPGVALRLPPGESAREVWETGHALLRRGFPVPRPLLFASDARAGAVVFDRASEQVSLADCLREPAAAFESDRGVLLASLGRLLRRLHDAGFDPAPEAFAVAADASPTLSRIDRVVQHRMRPARCRDGVARLLASLPTPEDRAAVLRHYGGSESFVRSVRSRLGEGSSSSDTGRPARKPATRRVAAALIFLAVSLGTLAGCRSIEKPPQAAVLPAKHSVRADHLLLVSDFKLPANDPLVTDLVELRKQVADTLQLPEARRDVTVYLFSNEEGYRKYLDDVHPGLPPRRAYFVGTKNELAVFTYWGDRVLEDLRHEYTHGILHASLTTVPLWLDEGLAEYFEVPAPGAMNGDYPYQLASSISRGWRPDIQRLEQLEEFSQMRRIDYQESWAWVHYLLHASPDTRSALLSYVGDLRDASHPAALSDRVAEIEPSFPSRFLGYVATLNSTGGAVIRAASAEF